MNKNQQTAKRCDTELGSCSPVVTFERHSGPQGPTQVKLQGPEWATLGVSYKKPRWRGVTNLPLRASCGSSFETQKHEHAHSLWGGRLVFGAAAYSLSKQKPYISTFVAEHLALWCFIVFELKSTAVLPEVFRRSIITTCGILIV